ncbi:hypothetical protein [Bacillus sp. UMB0893]|uniref:hypothetical protein n=1 Tax=Bacillus sp. UMB0893 TaxID=2066053 RepID=UPI0008A9A163|nr:hypothetical protein [Bacillus sp. UMB0893]OHR74756.1 hypothetical protein HMPREF3291_00025 [Bacillus sp. HMSC76G11]PLR65665.1 hypothetical protein CYJ36_22735 [Bacillus sp. UMB0893]
MSWEETYRREYPCNCGKSTYTEVGEMDDWNRSREYVIINCPECAENAKTVEAERRRQEAENTARLKELVLELKPYFEEHYMQNWLDYFVSARNKKAAWALAKEIGVESQSLSSFYQLNKDSSVEDYVRGLARPYNMLKIIEALKINDSFFKSKVEESVNLNKSVHVIGFY